MKKIKTEIYSRVSGYFRPTSQWNAGKREEFSERKTINMEKINIDNRMDTLEFFRIPDKKK